ncbi:FAD-dependent monooxygenase [Caulobacter sp. S45]|uniref:FAD-dependent monooxygenase n=1 Tax=Caulobacter sp. S45 TaxID=1641861 RepID=UPI0015763830|nr:FAD-dependent monooxygenase [Caulobacter sp. S45]
MKVIVAGGGIGGLAAALSLAQRGAAVTVLERAPQLGEAGAGLQLSPNATRLLFRWGLEDELRRVGFAPLSADIRDRGGAVLLSTPLGAAAEQRWGAPYLQAHRADLHAILLASAGAAGVRMQVDCPVETFEDDGGGVRLRTRGETLDADVLIGADGIHSQVRAALAGPRPPRFTGQIAWRGLVETQRLPAGLIAPAATVWTAAGAHFVHYHVRGGELVNFVGFTSGARSAPESWTEPARPGEVAGAFDGWAPAVQALIAAQRGGCGWRSAVHDRAPSRRWTRGRSALLGDAAHPMPPYLAQGAGMAIEDAEAISRHLAGPLPPQEALRGYAAERFGRTRRVQAWAQRNGAIFHLPGPLRQAAFAVARSGGGGAARLDWLYGYVPPSELCP